MIELGNLFYIEAPIYERHFYPMIDFRKGTLSLSQLFLELILPSEAY